MHWRKPKVRSSIQRRRLLANGWEVGAGSIGPCKSLPMLVHWHIHMYMPWDATGGQMQRKAKIFMNNRSQAVRLPKEFQFNTQDVFIRKEGGKVVLSPRPFDWTSYLAE